MTNSLATRALLGVLLSLVCIQCSSTGLAGQQPSASTTRPGSRPLLDSWINAGFLLLEGTYGTELVAPWDVFDHVQYHAEGGIRVFTVAPSKDPVATAEGLRIVPDFTFDNHPDIDLLVVPSAENSRGSDLQKTGVVEWVRRTGTDADHVMSLCWGAFVLAEANLLDGLSCTTFPTDYENLAQRYPDLDVRVNASFVHDGPAITSQGGRKSYDAALYVVESLYGRKTAQGIAGGLLVPWPPQTQPRPTFVSDGPPVPSEEPAP